jgi:hypothetical protein
MLPKSMPFAVGVIIAAAVIAALSAWRWPNPFIGTLAAVLGARVAASGASSLYFSRSVHWTPVVMLLLGFALVVISCRSLISLSGITPRLARAGWLTLALLTPMLLAQTIRNGPPRLYWFISLAPLALGIAISSLGSVALGPLPGWRWALVGIVMSVTIPPASTRYTEWQRHQVQEERQRALAALPAVSPDTPYPKRAFHRGVCFTAESFVSYGSPESRNMLEQLPRFGVDSIALVPYFQARQNPVRLEPPGTDSWESEDGMEILGRLAHNRGLRVMLKPHGWKPPDKYDTPEFRRAWFAEYGKLMEHFARFAVKIHADLFAIGTEFGWLARYDNEWREIARRVRTIYPGPLTYAATQGPEFESITFWDALDYIGIDNYYPLDEKYSVSDMMRRIQTVHARFNKPVLFTEAGYSAVEGARYTPWEDETRKPLSLDEQAKCYRALLEAFYDKDWFAGVYWWKVGTNGYGGPQNSSMTPWRKPAMEVIREFYKKPRDVSGSERKR